MTPHGPAILFLGLGLCITSCVQKRTGVWGPIFNIQLPWLVSALGINFVILGAICTLTDKTPAQLTHQVYLLATLALLFFGLYAGAVAAKFTRQSIKQYFTEIGFDYLGLIIIWLLMYALATL